MLDICCTVDELLSAARVVNQQGRWDLIVQNNGRLANEILQVNDALIRDGIHDASNYDIPRLMEELRQAVAILPVRVS